MGNPATLKTNVFTSENQPAPEKKSRKGIPNRATVFKRWLDTKIQIADPTDPKAKKLKVTLLEAAALGQIKSATEGNTSAFKEIMDTLHGKIVEKSEVDLTVSKIEVVFTKSGTDK